MTSCWSPQWGSWRGPLTQRSKLTFAEGLGHSFISLYSLSLAPLHILYPGSRSLKWTLVSSTFRIATQIASGIELGAVDPFAGVALMEEHIRDANRFVTNVCMFTLFQVYSAIIQPCWRSERAQQLCGGNSDGTGQIQESLQRLGVISLNRPSQHPGRLKCCPVL